MHWRALELSPNAAAPREFTHLIEFSDESEPFGWNVVQIPAPIAGWRWVVAADGTSRRTPIRCSGLVPVHENERYQFDFADRSRRDFYSKAVERGPNNGGKYYRAARAWVLDGPVDPASAEDPLRWGGGMAEDVCGDCWNVRPIADGTHLLSIGWTIPGWTRFEAPTWRALVDGAAIVNLDMLSRYVVLDETKTYKIRSHRPENDREFSFASGAWAIRDAPPDRASGETKRARVDSS